MNEAFLTFDPALADYHNAGTMRAYSRCHSKRTHTAYQGMDILGGLLKPTSGEVVIDGTGLSGLSDSELARIRGREIGFIFQQYNLIPSLTATENVELSLRINGKTKIEARKRTVKLLKMIGLGHRLGNKPPQLSGGEQQRVAICRALANNPNIILGDEPTGNLDTKNGAMVLDTLKRLKEKEGYTI